MNTENLTTPTFTDFQASIVNTIESGEIPSCFPEVSAIDDVSLLKFDHNDIQGMLNRQFTAMSFKDAMQNLGMFGYISHSGAKYILDRVGHDKRFLDPLCGRGWIAKALEAQGASCIASDIDPTYSGVPVTSTLKIDAHESVKAHKELSDILILSWPERDNEADFLAAKEWGSDKPIILYGEWGRSCNSTDFLNNFRVIEIWEDFPDLIAKPTVHTKIGLGFFGA
ncbi:hypothetical protein [Vibrio owensii]|uniref:hypothetical protein n=1 Tax=Vibrio harveyi group TaxID=717610 RepID=UPI003CC5FF63